jgi:hypothetical protein
MTSAYDSATLRRAQLLVPPGEQEDRHRWPGRPLLAIGRRSVMVAALTAAMLTIPAVTPAVAASADTAGVSDIAGCIEEQRATWSDGSAAPWEACHSRSGIIGIEGSIAVSNPGTIFMAAGVPDKDGRTALARSRDGGRTWDRLKLPQEFWHIIAYTNVDRATNRLFYKSIAPISANEPGSQRVNPIGFSDDEGETWHITGIGGANGEPAQRGDMGAIFVGPPPAGTKTSAYPNVVYSCDFHPRASDPNSDVQCWRSLDGGKSFHVPDPANPTLRKATAPGCDAAAAIFPNRGVVGANGTVYLPVNRCGQWVVGVSTDAGKTFTWNEVPGAFGHRDPAIMADEQKNYPGCAGSVAFAGCPEVYQWYGQERLAQDANGTLYFIFNYHGTTMWTSKDNGKTWTGPALLSPRGVQTVFASIVAQGKGRLGLSYFGRQVGSQDWYGYMAMVENADDPRARKIATARVSADGNPLMPGRCCGSKKYRTPWAKVPEGGERSIAAIVGNYNIPEHGGLSFAPDGTLWATMFRDMTRDPNDSQSADYELTAGHMAPIGVSRP